MKIALVHDYLNQYGGAERVLEALGELFPNAPIYTLIYDPKITDKFFPGKKIRASFLQKIPFIKSHHRFFPPLMPLAVEKFDLSDYDLVISDSAAFSKGVITKTETPHICYCHTPTRYAWDDSHKYIREFSMPFLAKLFVPVFMNYLRLWDREAAYRVDRFVSNSEFVAKRIEKYYKQHATVIYPPVDTKFFTPSYKPAEKYYLMVGRLLVYKRFDIAIEAFNNLELPLKIIGSGPELKKLRKIANWNIEFLGEIHSDKLREYYQNCQALIFPQEEDFGIVALEAMACGRPVIAYRGGGALESIKEGKTGVFFDNQGVSSLAEAVKNFDLSKFNPKIIREHALKFDKEIFKKKIKDFVEKTYYENRDRY
ncbi:MAG: glycosyltransferase family 4 protein [Candidatus Portnoybacteria bacterium CG10_big_fil_rev_8_21_14_0_10_38_18]|uniref:Glycosyltransferase family 4 protein n=1 Tax=Candidatus Portnoybacteria bacterium CG10_big_fil_rev_8_21_14_0_10_38_18 TaxID=1974813 RepID=A0A2M8KCC5_9BACT|nr:MAG: glycosyltransferase family 4 protein [Candidatus Portnoybacteria bacterium CG10_big_fil_rev_8_21_14_0_10_38_18]